MSWVSFRWCGVVIASVGLALPGCGRIGFDLAAEGGPVVVDGGAGTSSAAGAASTAGGRPGAGGAGAGGAGAGGAGGAGAGGAGAGAGGSGAAAGGAAPSSGGVAGAGGAAPSSGGAPGTGGAVPAAGGAAAAGGAGTGGSSIVTTGIAAGDAGTCVIGTSGKLYCWGSNTSGALGGAGGAFSATPVVVTGPGEVGGFVEIAAGDYYGCARHADGTLYCWGNNSLGQLGTGDTSVRNSPNPVSLSTTVRQISAEFATTCAVLTDGSLWCWGDNAEGEAGQNDWPPVDARRPLLVPSGEPWRLVATGQGHVCGIREGGSLYCWGRNPLGELGQPAGGDAQIRFPTRVGTATDWTAVAGGQTYTCGIRAPGNLYCWGDNAFSAVAQSTGAVFYTPTRVGTDGDWSSVCVHSFHGCGIRRPGTLHCWGRNEEGQLGLPYALTVAVPTRVGARSDWAEVACGRFHTCVRATDGEAYCTGTPDDGQLGNGDVTTRHYALTAVSP